MSDLCRLCSRSFNAFELFDLSENPQIVENVEKFCHVLLEQNKLFPQSACSTCVDFINDFKRYAESVQKVQEDLRANAQIKVDAVFVTSEDVKTEIIEEFVDDINLNDYEEYQEYKEGDVKIEVLETSVKTRSKTKPIAIQTAIKKEPQEEIATSSKPKSTKKKKSTSKPKKSTPQAERSNTKSHNWKKRGRETDSEESDFAADDSDVDPDFKIKSDPESEAERSEESDGEVSEYPENFDDLDGYIPKRKLIIRRNIPKLSVFECNEPIEKIFKEELLEIPNTYIQALQIDDCYKNEDGSVSDLYLEENACTLWKDLKFFCKICKQNKGTGFLKYKHHIEEHTETSVKLKYFCNICKASVKYSEELLNHYLQHHYNMKYSCIVCSKLFWRFTSLFNHYVSCHPKENEEIFMCLICGEHRRSKDEIRTHKTEFHDIRNDCDDPEDPFNKPYEKECMKIALADRNPDGTIKQGGFKLVGNFRWQDLETKCLNCSETFSDLLEHMQHFERHHPNHKDTQRRFKCPLVATDRTDLCHGKMPRLINHITSQHFTHLKFCCLFCREMFWNFEALEAHYRLSHPTKYNENFILCQLCGQYQSTFIDAQKHLLYHQDPRKDPKFDSYNYFKMRQIKNDRIKRASELTASHFEEMIEKEDHQGVLEVADEEKLEDGSLTEACIARLQIRKWNEFEYPCNECYSVFNSPYELQQHYKFIHTDTKQTAYLCKICDKKLVGKMTMILAHMITHETMLRYSCAICSKCVSSHLSLFQHYVAEHPKQRSITMCLLCGIPTPGYNLPKHISSHNSVKVTPRKYTKRQKVVQCPHCDKVYKETKSLQKHILKHENPEPEQDYICEICAKVFKTRNLLKNHRDRHEKKTEWYFCPVEGCDFKSQHKYFMKYHKRFHSDERPWGCELCPQTFKSKESLKRHKEIHEPPKHACEHCSKMFVKKYDLKVHVRLHTGDFPYSCPTCGQSFPSWGNMQKHSQSRHGIDLASEKIKKRNQKKAVATQEQALAPANWENPFLHSLNLINPPK